MLKSSRARESSNAWSNDPAIGSLKSVDSCDIALRSSDDGRVHVTPIHAQTGRVLVLDDDPEICQVLKRLLGRTHDVVTADSGVEGRKILEQDQSFDVILCDLMMPDLTGMELHEWLSADYPALSRRMVFLTGGIFTRRAAEYLSSVSNLQVQKPFDSVELPRLVTDLVKSATGGKSRVRPPTHPGSA